MKNLIKREIYWVDTQCLRIPSDEDHYPLYLEYEEDPLDMLPTRGRIRHPSGWKRYSRKYDEYMIRAQNIINTSEGLHISELREKVKNTLRWTRGYQNRYSIDSFISDNMHTFEIENGKTYWKDMDGRYTRPSRWHYSWVYENIDGYMYILNIPRDRKGGISRREHYEGVTWRRKRDKERKKDNVRMALFYLTFINYPEMRKYIYKIQGEYNSLNNIEEESKVPRPTFTKKINEKWESWNRKYQLMKWRQATKSFTFEKRRRRDQIRTQLDEIMSGDYSSYYNSREYRWSLQRECHHFAQP